MGDIDQIDAMRDISCCWLVQRALERFDSRKDGIEIGHIAEDHAGHGAIVTAEVSDHRIGWHQGEAARFGMGEIEVATIEEHPGVGDAVPAKLGVGES
ncbi:MAG: hypothetical protein QM676_13940 [Novosphingobium sp.]